MKSALITGITGFDGDLVFDQIKPNGTLHKLMDISLLTNLGWEASVSLNDGLRKSYYYFSQIIDSSVSDVEN
jgi:GDP-L-fucose synthase